MFGFPLGKNRIENGHLGVFSLKMSIDFAQEEQHRTVLVAHGNHLNEVK